MEISLAQPEVPKSVGKGQDFGLSLIFDFLLHSFFLSMLNLVHVEFEHLPTFADLDSHPG